MTVDGALLPRIGVEDVDKLFPVEPDNTVNEDTYLVDLREYLGDDEPGEDDGRDWIVRGLVAAEMPAVLVGPPKQGKTFVLLSLALAIASGQPWLGLFPVVGGRRRALVLPLEDAHRETSRRIWRLARGLGMDPRDLDGWLAVDSSRPFYFDRPEDIARMRRTIKKFQPDVVFIDSLARTMTGDENSKRDVAAATRSWADLCREFGIAVVVVHHFRKGATGADDVQLGEKMRGSSDLHALVRHLVAIEPVPNAGHMFRVSTEGNLAFHPEPFAVELIDDVTSEGKKSIRLEHRGPVDDVKLNRALEAIVKALENARAEGVGLSKTQLRELVPGDNKLVDRAIRILEERGQIARAGSKAPFHLVALTPEPRGIDQP